MKAYQYSKLGLDNLAVIELPMPQPATRQVLVKFHAASLNYRDLLFAWGIYNPNPRLPAIPGSDGAGEIVSVGAGVTRWKVGDRVCPIFMQGWIEGPVTPEKASTALGGGGEFDGVLREFGAFHEEGLVRIPDYLSYAEAATLPCAAVTAWSALVEIGKIKAGDTILVLGTGGVSIFALQLAKLHGARVVATSSTDEKLARVRALGANETINYRQTPEWDREVLRLTGGVDHVVEVGGAGTLPKSAKAVRFGGLISVIGVLAKGEGFSPLPLIMKHLRMQGIFVGSRQMFEDMNHAISLAGMKPVIDRTYTFGQLREALDYMQSGSHFGKIVIQIVE